MKANVEAEGKAQEQAWIEAARQGDLESFNQLVLKYQDMLYHQAAYILKDPDWASDLVQDALIQAYRSLHSFHGTSFRAWLMRILINASLDEFRRRKRHPQLPLERTGSEGEELESPEWMIDPGFSVEELVEHAELERIVQTALQTLPEEFRTALVLVDLQDFDYVEAAQALGLPIGTLKSRVARGRRRLREHFLRTAAIRQPVNGRVDRGQQDLVMDRTEFDFLSLQEAIG